MLTDLSLSKKITCMICGKHYKRKKERSKYKYVCQTYDNTKQCERHVIPHDFIWLCIKWHYIGYNLTDKEMYDRINIIEAYPYKIVVKYNDGTKPSFISDTEIDYGNDDTELYAKRIK